jgi:hypothetical protein
MLTKQLASHAGVPNCRLNPAISEDPEWQSPTLMGYTATTLQFSTKDIVFFT